MKKLISVSIVLFGWLSVLVGENTGLGDGYSGRGGLIELLIAWAGFLVVGVIFAYRYFFCRRKKNPNSSDL